MSPTTAFGPPFDHDDADIILRSSDKVDFHVHKIMLSLSSPFFKTMFSLPQANESLSDKHHPIVVDMSEDRTTIEALLTFIYSAVLPDPPEFDSLDEMMDALVAATKYEMVVASQRLKQQFAESKFVKDGPVVAFFAAYSRKLGDAARIAAVASLRYPMNLDNIADKLQHVDVIHGLALYRLYKFHRACSATAAQVISGPRTDDDLGLRRNTYHDVITRARKVLLEQPCPEAVTKDPFLESLYIDHVCSTCRSTLRGLPEFSRLLGKEVEKRISEVRAKIFACTSLNDLYQRLN
jgi:hypothetical protein